VILDGGSPPTGAARTQQIRGLDCIPPLRPCFGTPPTRHSRGRYDFSKAVISSARGSPGAVDEVSSGLLTGLAFALVLGGATWLAVGLIEWAETR
jgi:hypothetical protein